MSIGPSLPPHLTGKRRRSDASSSSEESGPAPPSAPRAIGPIFPPADEEEPVEKRRRLGNDKAAPTAAIGPALPPPTDSTSPIIPPVDDNSDEDSEDDYGPSLPSANAPSDPSPVSEQPNLNTSHDRPAKSDLKREDWMLAPPSGSSLSNLSGPIKARGFASGKAASRAAATGNENTWTETMEQKQARLRAEVLGTGDESVSGRNGQRKVDRERIEDEERRTKRDREMRERVKAYEDVNGGKKSLYEQSKKKKGQDEEDDPSKRAFDREKDIGSGGLGRKERMAFVDSAKGFGGRFSTGKFL